ncbi:MAG: T9SS type A sorting domain-containing protein [Bacteroidetes bacterium]|nr:T9SS type A sorting domain-containing protein [Bacteroidota bacterium]
MLLNFGLQAQSLKIQEWHQAKDITGDTVNLLFYDNSFHGWQSLNIEIFLTNKSNKQIVVGAKKIEYNKISKASHTFCFAFNCYDEKTYISPNYDTLKAGASDSSFSAHFLFQDSVHPASIYRTAYVFYDVANPTDSSIVYVNYDSRRIIGIIENSGGDFFFSNPFPTPSNGTSTIRYQCNKNFTMAMINTLGQTVFCGAHKLGSGEIIIDATHLQKGIYYCNILMQGGTRITKKIMVN